jgi:hypothetical protein
VTKAIQSQAKGSPQLMDFLLWYSQEQFNKNIFVEDYSKRQLADGKAIMAEQMFNLFEELNT